ncbi:unnamed protein product [Closterium sp. NIES-54]
MCGLRVHSDYGGEFSSTRLETFCHGQGIIQSYTLPASPQQNGVAEQHIGLVMEVARTSMCHVGGPQFFLPQAVRYATHQLNLWPSDARPRRKLSVRSYACVFLGFPLDTSGWAFYDPVTYEFFASHDVTFDESVCYYRSRPHRVHVVSGSAGGAVAEGEGTRAAGAHGVGSGGAGGVGVEVTPVEDTAALSWRPRPTSPPGFPSVPQFPPRSSLRPVAAEPGGVPAGGTRGPGSVGGGGAGSGGAGAGGTSIVAPTPRTVRFLTHEQRLLRFKREERERFERAQQQQNQQQQQQHSHSQQQERLEEESQQQQERAEEGSRLQ